MEQAWGIDFRSYFRDELPKLAPMETDGLLETSEGGIDVLPRGRLLIRNICMVFDAYLAAKEGPVGFSKVI